MNAPGNAQRFSVLWFADSVLLADALAKQVAMDLRSALTVRGGALLAVSGGTTPRRFLEHLAAQLLDWQRVVVTLCDERWVDEGDPRSNARLVRETLLRGPAAAATFVPLYTDAPSPEAAMQEIERRIAGLPLPFDAVVLGMGSDGHTASLFPDAANLAQALDPANPCHVLPIRAASAGEPRMTLTLSVLAGSRRIYLHIEGVQKKAVLDRMLQSDDPSAYAPVRAVLHLAQSAPVIYWCP